MSDGIFISNRPQLAIARETVLFAAMGLNDPSLVRIIYKIGSPFLSYIPTDEYNSISGIERGESYLLYLNQFYDGSPLLANAVLDNLIPQTSTNVFADERTVFICTASVDFTTAGITTTNTNLIVLVNEGFFISYNPNEADNGITGFVEGFIYYIDPIEDIDLHAYGVTEVRYADEVIYLDDLEDVVITDPDPLVLPLSEEEVLVRNLTTGIWENKPVSGLPTGSYTDTDARAAISLTTTGTSGAATYDDTTGVLNVPQYTGTDTHIGNTDLTLAADRTLDGNGHYLKFTNGRFLRAKGANIAAANDLTLGSDGNVFVITGNTQINAITATNWVGGPDVILLFTGTPTIKHNTSGGAGTAKIILSGSADYTAAADDVLVLFYDGTNWHEATRKVAATGGGKGFTNATNGLTAANPTTVKLGGTLTEDTTIDCGTTNELYITANQTNKAAFKVTNSHATGGAAIEGIASGSGSAVAGISSSGQGARGVSSSGQGVYGESVSGDGVQGRTSSAYGVTAYKFNSATNDKAGVLQVLRFSSGTVTNGYGGYIDFGNEISTGNGEISGSIGSYWKDVSSSNLKSALIKRVRWGASNVIIEEETGAQINTTNASPTNLMTLPIPDESCGIIEVNIVAKHNLTSGIVVGKKIFRYLKDGGTLTLGTITTVLPDEATGVISTATYAISVVSNELSIDITGVASQNITWVASLKIKPSA